MKSKSHIQPNSRQLAVIKAAGASQIATQRLAASAAAVAGLPELVDQYKSARLSVQILSVFCQHSPHSP